MKALTQRELESIGAELNSWQGAFLQEFWATTQQLALGLYLKGEMKWVLFDLDPIKPLLVKLTRAPQKSKKVTPVMLFLKAHARGRALSHVETSTEAGRVMCLHFGRDETACVVEFRAFPHGQNLIVRSEKSQISWQKLKELPPAQVAQVDESPRTWDDISREWEGRLSRSQQTPKDEAQTKRDIENRIARKQKALGEIEKALGVETPWQEIGEHLKVHALHHIPEEWRPFLDFSQSASSNMQTVFAKAKQVQRKRDGQLERIRVLNDEIANLQKLFENPDPQALALLNAKPAPPPKMKADVKWRTFQSKAGFVLHVGKSARDNLHLLRSARAWDLWLHLRDFPGSHGIVRRERDQVVPRQDLEELACALAKASLSQKAVAGLGGKFDVLVAERRYVRALKGDQLGRVHYTKEQVLTVALS